jgi:N-methylhydantoinase A
VQPKETLAPGSSDASAAITGTRSVYLDREQQVTLYSRERLLAGNVVIGPAIVEQVDSTTLVLRGWRAVVDASGTLVLTRDQDAG